MRPFGSRTPIRIASFIIERVLCQSNNSHSTLTFSITNHPQMNSIFHFYLFQSKTELLICSNKYRCNRQIDINVNAIIFPVHLIRRRILLLACFLSRRHHCIETVQKSVAITAAVTVHTKCLLCFIGSESPKCETPFSGFML